MKAPPTSALAACKLGKHCINSKVSNSSLNDFQSIGMPITVKVSTDSLSLSHLHFLPPPKKNRSINENTFSPFDVIKALSLRTKNKYCCVANINTSKDQPKSNLEDAP